MAHGSADLDEARALRVVGVEKRFGALRVLQGVDLSLSPGSVLALVGENGAGKSTLVRCIAGTDPADAGRIEVAGRAPGEDGRIGGVGVVWQDLALCDNLSAISNLFLGNERTRRSLLDESAMTEEAMRLFERLRISIPDLNAPVSRLSGGQRQLLAIARAFVSQPSLLILDEPTSSLGVAETELVERLLGRLRSGGTAILLVSHRLEQVFKLADRIAVLREGRIVADVSPLEVHPDDVAALISGIDADSTARRQLRLLQSLVEELAEVAPAASLPLIVSATAEALAVDRVCVHLLDRPEDGNAALRRSAAIGLSGSLLDALHVLPLGEAGGPPGLAASTGGAVVLEDIRVDRRWAGWLNGCRSAWSVPIVGSFGLVGTISGFSDMAGRPQPDQLELISVYASYAAAAVDRERLLADATRRNRVLETLRGILDTLAGPQTADGGLEVTLLALCRGLGADAIALHHADGRRAELWARAVTDPIATRALEQQRTAAAGLLGSTTRVDRARPVTDDVLAVPIEAPSGRAIVTAWWADPGRVSNDAIDLLDDAARSLRLALEREALEAVNAEAESLRRSQGMQREFLSRLNHELRTPLTAIQGFASTLRQPDVTWDTGSQQRFLDSIASESARMARLVGDLLDFNAIDAGTLRLVEDWCDIGLVIEAALGCVSDSTELPVELEGCAALPALWGDHDRLEQVFVNLLENASRHAIGATTVRVVAAHDPLRDTLSVVVADDGVGIGPELADRVFLPHEHGDQLTAGTGLGLAIARGIVEAHGGSIGLDPSLRGAAVHVVLPVEPRRAPQLPEPQLS